MAIGIEPRFSYKEIYDFDMDLRNTREREGKAEPPI